MAQCTTLTRSSRKIAGNDKTAEVYRQTDTEDLKILAKAGKKYEAKDLGGQRIE